MNSMLNNMTTGLRGRHAHLWGQHASGRRLALPPTSCETE